MKFLNWLAAVNRKMLFRVLGVGRIAAKTFPAGIPDRLFF
jgi:hypothetical protein